MLILGWSKKIVDLNCTLVNMQFEADNEYKISRENLVMSLPNQTDLVCLAFILQVSSVDYSGIQVAYLVPSQQKPYTLTN